MLGSYVILMLTLIVVKQSKSVQNLDHFIVSQNVVYSPFCLPNV